MTKLADLVQAIRDQLMFHSHCVYAAFREFYGRQAGTPWTGVTQPELPASSYDLIGIVKSLLIMPEYGSYSTGQHLHKKPYTTSSLWTSTSSHNTKPGLELTRKIC